MDYFGIPKGRNIKIQKLIFGPYLSVLKNMGALCIEFNVGRIFNFCFCLYFIRACFLNPIQAEEGKNTPVLSFVRKTQKQTKCQKHDPENSV